MCIIFSPVCNGRCWAKIKKRNRLPIFLSLGSFVVFFLHLVSGSQKDDEIKIQEGFVALCPSGCEDLGVNRALAVVKTKVMIMGHRESPTVISKQRWYQNNGDIKTTVNHRRWYQNTKAENFSSTKFQFWQVGLKSLFNCFNIPTNTPLEHSGIIQIALFAQNVVICKLASRYWWLIDFPPAMFVLCTRFRCSRCLALFWNILSNYVGRGWGMRGWSPQQGNFPCPPFGEV